MTIVDTTPKKGELIILPYAIALKLLSNTRTFSFILQFKIVKKIVYLCLKGKYIYLLLHRQQIYPYLHQANDEITKP